MTPVRRIVTGHLADGRSTVLIDGSAPNVKRRQAGNASTLLWVTDVCRLGMVFIDAEEPAELLAAK